MSSTYRINVTSSAEQQTRRLLRGGTPAFRQRLEEALTRLSDDPYPSPKGQGRFRIKRLGNGEWSMRIDYRHRILYRVDGQAVTVTRVSPRENAYDGV